MYKVKNYMDSNKEKARHRNRIDETRRTKANRIRKCKNEAYGRFCCWMPNCGYEYITERKTYRYEYYDVPETKLVRLGLEWDYYNKTKPWHIVNKKVTIPAHIDRKRLEKIKPVSILKRNSAGKKKLYKKFSARRFRRKVCINEDSYWLLKGNAYKKDSDIKWLGCIGNSSKKNSSTHN